MKPNPFFPEMHGNFGFGFMRLPMDEDQVDLKQTEQMVDAFMDSGFNYFDTAHGYLDGKSELALRETLVKRYPREKYLMTNKLSDYFFETEADIRPLFRKQLECCGVEYFDFYLMHAQSAKSFEKYKRCHAYETAFALKEEGCIRHVGISFHDTADVLDQILTEYPQIEAVQIQFNYLDYEDPVVQSRQVYETCVKHGKPVFVMEPVKGGSLAVLPEKAQSILTQLDDQKSAASFAVRFAAGFPQMAMVLSGMSTPEQVQDNLNAMTDYKPLSEREQDAIVQVCGVFRDLDMVACTGCHYCVLDNDCPANIQIPEMFACYNKKKIFDSWNQDFYYEDVLTRDQGKASDCLSCGGCENICPQHLPIRKLLQDVAKEFEAE